MFDLYTNVEQCSNENGLFAFVLVLFNRNIELFIKIKYLICILKSKDGL